MAKEYFGPESLDELSRLINKDIKNSSSTGDGSSGSGEAGKDGFSPVVKVTEIEGGHKLSVTDAEGEKSFDVMNGKDGTNGQDGADGLNGRDGVDGKPGTNGSDGKDGVDGTDGVSPTVTITEIDGGHRVSITDATGTKSFDVMDGVSPSSPSNPSSYELINASIGSIVGWYGTEDTIPEGWHICDGEDGTYDLRGKFMLGADLRKDAEGNAIHPIGETGGSEEVKLTVEQMPAHTHVEQVIDSNGRPVSYMNNVKNSTLTGCFISPSVIETTTTSSASVLTKAKGSSQPHPNMPPFFSLIFIQKVGVTPTDYVTEERMDEKIGEALSSIDPPTINEVYSTTETRIGTWIDGKPLYRKVLSLTTPSVQNQVGYYQIPGLGSDQFLAIKYDGFVQANDHSRNPIISYVPSSQNFSIVWHDTNNGIGMMVANQLVSKQAYLIIEYTKNVDEPTITIGT